MDVGGTGGTKCLSRKTGKDQITIREMNLCRKVDIEEIQKYIGEKIKAECFVDETLPFI